MPKRPSLPTRAEFKRLKEAHDQLASDVEILKRLVNEQKHELNVQFTRIAVMQAILDEERDQSRPTASRAYPRIQRIVARP